MNRNRQIGWVICEEAAEPIDTPKIISSGKNRRVTGRGTLQRAESKNRNGRWYGKKELFGQVGCPRTKEMLRTGFGSENGHPLSQDLARQQTIDPNNVVAFFKDIWTEGDLIKADFFGSNLPIGEAFDQDLRDGLLPAWSLRALGSIENTPRGAEVRGLKVITWDRVYYPSHPEAYTDGIVSESGILLPNNNWKTPTPNQQFNESGMVTPILTHDVLDYIEHESCNIKTVKESFDIFFDEISLTENGKVKLIDKDGGNVYIINLEQHLHNEIMDYCSRL